MKAKIGDLIRASAVFYKLLKVESFPPKAKYRIIKMRDKLQKEIDAFNSAKDDLLRKHGVPGKDEAGNEIQGQFNLTGEGLKAFSAGIAEIEKEEVDFPEKIECLSNNDFSWYDVVDGKPVIRFLSAEELFLMESLLDFKE